MNKPKIHELAKELNVTSKRLMEKLSEIGIHPKSHMTTLEDDELERLYKHIGVVNRNKDDTGVSQGDSESKSEHSEKTARRNIPRIIRKTEVIIHDDDPLLENADKKEKRSLVRASDSNDGLIAGFTRSKDSIITSVKKRTRQEPAKNTKESVFQLETERADRQKSPVGDILSIKKVSRVTDKTTAKDESGKAKEQENMQRDSILESTGIKSVKKVDKAVRMPAKAEEPGKAEKAKSEKTAEKATASDKAEKTGVISAEKAPDKRKESQEKAHKDSPKPQVSAQESSREKAGDTGAREDDSQRQSDSRARDDGTRADGVRGQRQGDSRVSRGGRRGDKAYGARSPYNKSDKPGESKREDGRSHGGSKNKPLAIPKATPLAGAPEEKVPTRGERRIFQGVDRQKEEKKELKKDVARFAASNQNRGTNIRRKIDTVVGHKAKVTDMMSDDFVINVFYDDADEAINVKRAEKRLKKRQKVKHIPPKAVLTDITVSEKLTVKELAEALKKTAAEVIKRLFMMGIVATQNQELDYETAAIIGDEFGVKVHKEVVVSQEDILFDDSEDAEEDLVPRAPVVVVMGHVDHGKTSLLDAIRNANTAEREAGGITQHIGAYTVKLNGRDITFLDTPGHEAFTAMRARGAQITDIAILVVAADDGVMPQTIEAINHAKAAGVSIVVAINKIDRPNANPDRVKQELAEHGLLIEEWGGDVIAVPVSAKKQENIDQLLEMVLLTADILELKANPNRQAKGTIIEAQLDKNRGPVATLLVQRGTLRTGDAILSGTTFGHVRSMTNDKGRKIKEAGPSIPVEIFGLSEVPQAGDTFYVVTDEKLAKQLAEKRKEEQREKQIGRAKISLEDLFSQIQQGNVKELNLIVKADVQGSVEAIRQSMEKLSNDEVKVKVIHGAVGAVIEADVTLAQVSNAIIIGFNVRPSANVSEFAQEAGVDIRLYRVIYDAIEDIEKAMKGMLEPTYKEVVNGHAEIRQLFKISSVGTIGGSYVTDGKILRNSDIRVVRNGIVVFEGKLASLKRFKDDVKEVAAGYECGIMIERYNDIKEGDIIESFSMEEVKRQ